MFLARNIAIFDDGVIYLIENALINAKLKFIHDILGKKKSCTDYISVQKQKNTKIYKTDKISISDSTVVGIIYKRDLCSKDIPDNFADKINFDLEKRPHIENDMIYMDGIVCGLSDIPEIRSSRCLPIIANDNVLNFESGQYYGFLGTDGKNHVIACQKYSLHRPFSEELRTDKADAELNKICLFWNLMSYNNSYISLYFTKEEQINMLESAGICHGFFSVRTGENQQEYFLSSGNEVAVLKSKYDDQYEGFRSGILCRTFKVGSTITIDGVDYVVGEDGKIDVPYGADIFSVKWPKPHER